jgi:DNA/RNA endonuclease G (NUC1)
MLVDNLKSIINFTNCKFILDNGGFAINYSTELGRPLWSVYSLNKFNINDQTGGRTHFKLDERLKDKNIYQLKPNDKIFQNKYFSRGHLVPAFMMSHLKNGVNSWNKTFLMSNIVPQNINLNKNSWYKLERETKKLILKNDSDVHVIVGCDTLDFSEKYFIKNENFKFINDKNLIWFDEKNKKNYVIPNIFYQVIITQYEVLCYFANNNSDQIVNKISLDYLEKLINKKLLV